MVFVHRRRRVLAIGIALLLKPFFPFQIVLSSSVYLLLAVVSIAVGLVASLAGLRRVIGVDPALAFGNV